MSLRVRILQIDVPAAQLDQATVFWAAALGAHAVASPAGFVHLHDARSVVEVHLQPLGEGAARYHLDLEVIGPGGPVGAAGPTGPVPVGPSGPAGGDPTDARLAQRGPEVARLADLGATVGAHSPDGYTVLHDPAGLPLCVIEPWAAPRNPLAERTGDRGHLGVVRLDVPDSDRQPEVTFWAAALGNGVGEPGDGYVPIVGVAGPGGPIDLHVRRIEDVPRVGVELDAKDVPTEVARLEALGATRVTGSGPRFTLADPVGNLLCVVPTRDGDET